MFVKICGMKSLADAQSAVAEGADLVGFIFAKSSRKISPELARNIGSELPGPVKKVGVFSNQTEQEVIEIANEAGLDYIQLHGNEPASFATRMPLPVIKAFSIRTEKDLENLSEYPAEFLLLDLPKGPGSKALTLDWKMLKQANLPLHKVFLAGGLTPENVEEAISLVSPVGVDVASGVETDGVKDATKIERFIRKAKNNEERGIE